MFLAARARSRAHPAPGDPQARANNELWGRPDLLAYYTSRVLKPSEAAILDRFGAQLTGRVLELGPGGGRVTAHLVERAEALHGIDVSEEMVEYCRREFPAATFAVGDLRTLIPKRGEWDAITLWGNLIDVLGWEDRGAVLSRLQTGLAPGGVLVLSSHNRAAEGTIRTPLQEVRWRDPRHLPGDLARLPRQLRNRHRVLPHEHREDDWALLNDVSHDFEALHLYVRRSAQERQLADAGYEVLAVIDTTGRGVAPGDDASAHSELHYVARRPEDPAGTERARFVRELGDEPGAS